MHYDGTWKGYFRKNPIMKDRITGKTIGINRELSKIDIEKLNKMYPCTPTSKPTAPARGKSRYFLTIGRLKPSYNSRLLIT